MSLWLILTVSVKLQEENSKSIARKNGFSPKKNFELRSILKIIQKGICSLAFSLILGIKKNLNGNVISWMSVYERPFNIKGGNQHIYCRQTMKGYKYPILNVKKPHLKEREIDFFHIAFYLFIFYKAHAVIWKQVSSCSTVPMLQENEHSNIFETHLV